MLQLNMRKSVLDALPSLLRETNMNQTLNYRLAFAVMSGLYHIFVDQKEDRSKKRQQADQARGNLWAPEVKTFFFFFSR